MLTMWTVIALNLADLALTLVECRLGADELNPVLSLLGLQTGAGVAVAFKVIVPTAAAVGLYALRNRSRLAKQGLVGLAVILAGLLMYHALNLAGAYLGTALRL